LAIRSEKADSDIARNKNSKSRKILEAKWRMIFESNISLKEDNWEGNGNTERSVVYSSKQTKN